MLLDMRTWVKGKIAKLILAAVILVFVFWGASNSLISNPEAEPIATVNGEEISRQSFLIAVQDQILRQEGLYKQLGINMPVDEKQIRSRVRKELIQQKVMSTTAQALSYDVGNAALHNQLNQIPQFQKDGKFSPEAFNEVASALNYPPALLLENIKESFLIGQLPQALSLSSFSLDNVSEKLYRLQKQTRDADYLMISSDQLTPEPPTDDAINSYYQQNQQDFYTKEKLSIDYVILDYQTVKDRIHPSKAELEAYYQDHMQQYQIPGAWHVAHILIADNDADKVHQIKQSISSENFAELAKKYSDDSNANLGGDLGWMLSSNAEPAFYQAMKELNSAQPISGPIQTKYGTHFIKLIESKPEHLISFNEARNEIETQLVNQQAHANFADLKEQLSVVAYETSDTLEEVSKQFELKIQSSDAFSREGEIKGIAANPQVVRAAYSTDVMQDEMNSEVIALSDKDPMNKEALVVLRLKKHYPAELNTLETVKVDIDAILRTQAKQSMARDLGETLLAQITKLPSNSSLPNSKMAAWQALNAVSRTDSKIDSVNLRSLFELKLAEPSGDYSGSVAGSALPNGYAIIVLKGINQPKLADNDPDYQQFRAKRKEDIALAEYDAYSQQAQRQAKIEVSG